MNLEITVLKNVSSRLRKELKIFSDTNWGDHVDPSKEILLNFFLPFDMAVLTKDNDKNVGLIEVFLKKKARMGEENIYVGGIGGVVTHKGYRHQGIATAMLKKVLEVLKEEKVDIAMLCTEIDRLGSLYKNVGFIPLGRSYVFTDKNGNLKEDKGGMIAQVLSKEVFEKILLSKEIINVGVSNF